MGNNVSSRYYEDLNAATVGHGQPMETRRAAIRRFDSSLARHLFQNMDCGQFLVAKGRAPFSILVAVGHAFESSPFHHEEFYEKRRLRVQNRGMYFPSAGEYAGGASVFADG